MKEHLEKVHKWSIKQNEIPAAFLKSYERWQNGWICGCGETLGNWFEAKEQIVDHAAVCVEGLQASLKRMSVDGPGKEGDGKNGTEAVHKALPHFISQHDKDWYMACLNNLSQ